jgi:predicted ABC-class ATPase
MDPIDDLYDRLRALDGKGYKAYKGVRAPYEAERLLLTIEHVQGDPYAEPSRLRADVDPAHAQLPPWACRDPVRRRATADFLNRAVYRALSAASGTAGSGKSGALRILRPGQEVLDRAAVEVHAGGGVVARFRVGLPARGRRILGQAAAELVAAAIAALEGALLFPALDGDALRRHVETVEDAHRLRAQLEDRGLVAFVADGARLPRRSGIDDRPLEGDRVVPFEAPESLAVTLDAPNAGPLRGLGVPRGVTLIVGGGYHGKSTLLRAVERGVYDHVPGDGRERVVAVPDAVKIRAEDGRRVAGTDISNFIGRLPAGGDTRTFHTENASGSTSQAAAIIEALEVGARVLLLDEDTSATNFMIRDARMQRLIDPRNEPITPFIDRARTLHDDLGVSTVVVVGGSGDYFDVADTVIALQEYRPVDVTDRAHEIARSMPTRRAAEGASWRPIRERRPVAASIDPGRGRRTASIRVRARDRLDFGSDTVELGAVEQIVETAQTRALAHAAVWARDRAMAGDRPLSAVVRDVIEATQADGLTILHPHGIGELTEFRPYELAAFLNRLRSLEIEEDV